jgi:hopanoid-associated phosphorylase
MRRLEAVNVTGVQAVVSFGIAGALDPRLRVGDVVLATEIIGDDGRIQASAELRRNWTDRLRGTTIPAVECAILGVDEPALTPAAKAGLHARSGAGAVDMESHLAAAFAARHGLPFGAIRVVSDRADHALPPAAGTAMRPDGSVDVLSVVGSLLRDPRQIPGLLATARNAAIAFRQLGRVRGLLRLRSGLLGLDL